VSDEPATGTLSIDIISDVMCPWCFIGRERLMKALAAVPEIGVEIRWRPYQLDATLPREGKDRKQYLVEKFGGEDRAAAAYRAVREAGLSEGIRFDFDAIRVSPNTLDAHRVIRWATTAGDGVQDRVARRLFELYFEEGANIGDHAVLAGAAGDAGMDASVVSALLATDADSDAVRAEVAVAQRMGVTGVPCFVIEGRYAIVGAQEPEAIAHALRQIAGAKAAGRLETA
jgi:predicted DsbA family dithiol-disulfide isomerase